MGNFLFDDCVFSELTEEIIQSSDAFSCKNNDLDEFFNVDSFHYSRQLLGKTYCFRLAANVRKIVCAFTISNDSIRVDDLPNSRGKKIKSVVPREKSMRRFPGVLIGRLGVSQEFQGKGIGTELMDFIKSWFVVSNKTGCRFLIVDAYNDKNTLNYYESNGFKYLFSTENQEYLSIFREEETQGESLKTRLMYFDLIELTRFE
ncbi:MAG: GNAT family N-acetyltransferase [bacterium]|nr:GNAT family N-acetyltransferase [Candidatus Limimorpha equi]